jgi:predicted Zn-dependent protease
MPTDLATLRAAATFYFRSNDPKRARELCERVLAMKELELEEKQFAVQILSVIVTTQHDYQTSRRLLEEIGVLERGLSTKLTGLESSEQLRARAVALAVQPDSKLRREAISSLESIELRQPLTIDDQFFLARLYVSVGDWKIARQRLTAIARGKADNLYYLAYYGSAVLHHDGDVVEARRIYDVLKQKQPNATYTIAIQSRILEAEGKSDEAAEVLKNYARLQPQRLEFAAGLLERIGLGDRAEELYRKLASDPTRPTAVMTLASYLGREGRSSDALAVLRSLAKTVPVQVLAAAAVEVLYNASQPEPGLIREIEGLIQASGPTSKDYDPRKLTAIVRMVEGRHIEAITLYREVVAGGSADAMTLNNLGYLLATEDKQFEEGLEYVRKAQKLAGPISTLRDTEAVILMRMGKPREAVALLTEVTKESGEASMYFHLAQAHTALNNVNAATAAIEQARRLKIRHRDVPPSERVELSRVLTTHRE